MSETTTDLDRVGRVLELLRRIGFEPVLVGGMALVVLGSRRVTQDFDFLVSRPGDKAAALIRLLYAEGFELASRVNDAGGITAVIDNAKVAGARMSIDKPDTAFFRHRDTGLRVDLLFDFPTPAAVLAERASRITIRSRRWLIASEADLLDLKRAARASRAKPGDADDIEFLESRLRGNAR